jgi:hypothetical protein
MIQLNDHSKTNLKGENEPARRERDRAATGVVNDGDFNPDDNSERRGEVIEVRINWERNGDE